LAARGEELPLASGATGAVVISSAWHWLDAGRAWPEITGVIEPGGVFAVMWSGPDRTVPLVDEVLKPRWGDQPPSVVGDSPAARPELAEGAMVDLPLRCRVWLAVRT
jgi:Methyltransferase domain